MKKILYFAIAFASFSLSSCACGSKKDVQANTKQECCKEDGNKPCCKKDNKKECRGENRHEGRHGHEGHHGHKNPQEMIQFRVDRLAEKLNLTDEQKQKVTEVYTQQAVKFDSLRTAEREERRDEMKAIREEERAALKSILTQEQLAKLDTMKKANFNGPNHPRHHHDGPHHRHDGKHGGKHGDMREDHGPRHHHHGHEGEPTK